MRLTFDRRYILRIARNEKQVKVDSKDVVDASSSGGGIKVIDTKDLTAIGNTDGVRVIEIRDLHIEANIRIGKGKGFKNNPSTIKIYNLSQDSINKIQKDSLVILQAGYKDDVDLPYIFAGQAVSVVTGRDGANRVTSITCQGGHTIQKNVRLSKTFPKGTTYKKVIQGLLDEAAKYGLPTGHFKTTSTTPPKDAKNVADKLSVVLEDGYVVEGNLINSLTDIATGIGFKVYVSLGKLYVEPKDNPALSVVKEIYSSLIKGSIEPYVASSKSLTGDTTSSEGVKFSLFLDGEITLDKKIQVKDGNYAGTYDIESINHSLAYEGGEWSTGLELIKIG